MRSNFSWNCIAGGGILILIAMAIIMCTGRPLDPLVVTLILIATAAIVVGFGGIAFEIVLSSRDARVMREAFDIAIAGTIDPVFKKSLAQMMAEAQKYQELAAKALDQKVPLSQKEQVYLYRATRSIVDNALRGDFTPEELTKCAQSPHILLRVAGKVALVQRGHWPSDGISEDQEVLQVSRWHLNYELRSWIMTYGKVLELYALSNALRAVENTTRDIFDDLKP